ncbi:hypothetical protein RB599_010505 [Gaeumannomyces hyphopodioides]
MLLQSSNLVAFGLGALTILHGAGASAVPPSGCSSLNATSEENRALNARDDYPDPPKALRLKATRNDLKWQPVLDFDTDSCYNVPAIDKDGNLSKGLPASDGSSHCRDAKDLDNSNVYSRRRCNNGWCAYMYAYYFEKDVGLGGHRHDWEHVVVWVIDGVGILGQDEARWVSVSSHGGYEINMIRNVRMYEKTHPKVVYHKDGSMTHCFRFAYAKDEKLENHKGYWVRGALVSYNGFPGPGEGGAELRTKLFADKAFGNAHLGLRYGDFANELRKAKPNVKEIKDFNVDKDDRPQGVAS